MTTSFAIYQSIATRLPKALERVATLPEVQTESRRYLSRIGQIKSVDDFLSDDRTYRFAMRAFGLDDMIYAKGFVKRLLADGVDNSKSLANRLADPRYREFAEAFNFARYGATTTAFSRTQQGTVDRFVRQKLETDAGAINEGARLALYFQRKAEQVKSPYALLADRALLKVTQVALGLPESSSAASIDRQATRISARLDMADLQNAAKLNKFLQRFTALWDLQSPASGAAASTALPGDGTQDVSTLTNALGQRRS